MANEETKRKQMALLGIGITVGLVVVIFGTSKLLRSSQPEASPSSVVINGTGTGQKSEQPSQTYREQVATHNKEQAEKAERTGQSALPILLPGQAEPQQAARPATPQPMPMNSSQPQRATPEQAASADLNAARIDAMRRMVAGLLDRPQPSRLLISAGKEDDKAKAQTGSTGTTTGTAQNTQATEPPIAYAGDLIYAITNSDIDTDQPDIAHLTITAGPLTGGRFVGTATRQGEVVKVVVNSLFINRKAYDVTGQAMDVDTAKGVLSGDVDRKLLQRYGLPFLTGLVSGLGVAVAQGGTQIVANTAGSTTTTIPLNSRQIAGAAFGAGFMGINRQIQQSANNANPAVRIPAGHPVAVWLLSDVTQKTSNVTRAATEASGPAVAANGAGANQGILQQQQALQQQMQALQQQALQGQGLPGVTPGYGTAYPGMGYPSVYGGRPNLMGVFQQ